MFTCEIVPLFPSFHFQNSPTKMLKIDSKRGESDLEVIVESGPVEYGSDDKEGIINQLELFKFKIFDEQLTTYIGQLIFMGVLWNEKNPKDKQIMIDS